MNIDKNQLKNPSVDYRGKPFWAWNGEIEKDQIDFQVKCLKQMGFGGAFIHSRTGLLTEYMSDEWINKVKYAAEKLAENGLQAYLYDEDRWPSGTCGGYVTEVKEYRAKYMTYAEICKNDFCKYEQPENFIGLFAVKLKDGAAESYRKIGGLTQVERGERAFVFYYDYMSPDSFYNGYTYADTMNKDATERFLELTHEKYYKAFGSLFGNVIKGIFTDEPHRNPYLNGFGRKEPNAAREIPYTYKLFDEFEKRVGYKIQEDLPLLWFGDAKNEFCKQAYDLIEVEQQLFLENFAAPYRDWCRNHGILVTGHVLHEDNLAAQVTMCGSVMRYYEYMDIPGMDNLCEDNFAVNVPSLVKSVAKQLGKKFVLDELYAATGWKMTFADYKRTGNWQSFGGINVRCPHLSWYTMKGQAKRDYPASILHQSAWYKDFWVLEDYFSRLQYLLTEGEECESVAIINPVESLWGLTNERTYVNCFGSNDKTVCRLEREYYELFRYLRLNGAGADYIDEGLLSVHGANENGLLCVGKKKYDTVILNGNLNLRNSTLNFLKSFLKSGGKLILAGDMPKYLNGVKHDFSKDLSGAINMGFDPQKVLSFIKPKDFSVSGENIIAEVRKFEKSKVYFFLNRAEGDNRAEITIESDCNLFEIDLYSGQIKAFNYERKNGKAVINKTFARDQTLVILCSDEITFKEYEREIEKNELFVAEEVAFPKEFNFELSEPNLFPLDYAEMFINGEYFDSGDVLSLDEKLRDKFSLEKRCGEMIQPWFKKKYYPAPQKVCRITLKFEFYLNESFISCGKNLSLMTEDQNAGIYLNGEKISLKKVAATPIDSCYKLVELPLNVLKSGKNQLCIEFDFKDDYDIEQSFLSGDFAVLNDENQTLSVLPDKIVSGDLCLQGLKYYGGRIMLSAFIESGDYRLIARDLKAAVCYINDKAMAFLPYKTDFNVKDGKIKIELILTRQNSFGTEWKNGTRTGIIPVGLYDDVKLYKLKQKKD